MCRHGGVKFRWAQNGAAKQIAGYCQLCDSFLFWGKKVAGKITVPVAGMVTEEPGFKVTVPVAVQLKLF